MRICSFGAQRGDQISRIIIDGYNVIGLSHRDIDRAREDFIQLLIRYRAAIDHDITAIFDGYMHGPALEQRIVRGKVEIIFTRLGEKADDAIKRIISRDRREWIVVSSDRDVISHAWSLDSVPVRSEVFHGAVLRRLSAHARDIATGGRDVWTAFAPSARDEEDDNVSRKGNPRMQSRRQRSVARALRKL